MFYCTINTIKKFESCPDGPKILRWHEDRYGPDELIPLSVTLKQWGTVHTMFVLRAGPEGVKFALHCALACAKRVTRVFEKAFDNNLLVFSCIEIAELRLRKLNHMVTPRLCLETGRVTEEFCRKQLANDKGRLAGMAAARCAYAAFALNSGPTAVGYCLGACEDAANAADDVHIEIKWQQAAFADALSAHVGEVILGEEGTCGL